MFMGTIPGLLSFHVLDLIDQQLKCRLCLHFLLRGEQFCQVSHPGMPGFDAFLDDGIPFRRKTEQFATAILWIFKAQDEPLVNQFIHHLADSGIRDTQEFSQVADTALIVVMQAKKRIHLGHRKPHRLAVTEQVMHGAAHGHFDQGL
jgi:hypothetical protein